METTKQLSAEDRAFFQVAAEAASVNPFSDRYPELLGQLAGCDANTEPDSRAHLMIARLGERVAKLDAAGAATLRQFAGDDQALLRYVFLFEVYHRFIPAFDELIVNQLAAGEQPVPVPFAARGLRLLAQRGFAADDSRRFLAIFYQIRRAFYFIHRGLVGASPCLRQLRRHLWNNVFTHDIRAYEQQLWNRLEDFSTLLLGETGTGKGTAAAAIGRSGFIPFDEKKGCFTESFVRSFVALNLSQFPETLIESELFGHKKGAFTGAVDHHEGAFARCSAHGAIFLDEIGDLSVPVQIKLLQVLQERTFTPVGSHDRLRFRGRVIAATNHPLDEHRATGRFREDFFYRLCSDVITVPPLRQRIAEEPRELDDLIVSILQRVVGNADDADALRDRLLASVGRDYAWPGNVRELEQAVRRVLLTGEYRGDHRAVAPGLRSRLLNGVDTGKIDADALLAGYCALLHERHGTIEEVARRTNLDRRTVKGYLAKHRRG